MIIEDIDLSALPSDPESAFIRYVSLLRNALEKAREADSEKFRDMNGEYVGNYAPDRFFASSIIAFLDEHNFDSWEIEDISELPNNSFIENFPGFETRVNYLISRLHIRKTKLDHPLGTPAYIESNFKSEINKHLETIRKIIEQTITDQNKKEEILKKLYSLQLEINRDRTSFDALMQRIVDFGTSLGIAGERSEPLIDKLERLKKLIFEGVRSESSLPKPERRKKLPSPDKTADNQDDDIPF